LRGLIDGTGLIALLPVGAFACAPSGEILFFNDRAVELWGRTPERFEPLERFCGAFRLLHRDGSAILPDETPMAVALATGISIEGVETILERPDGSRTRFQSHVRVILDELNMALGAIEVFHERNATSFDRYAITEPLMQMVRAIQVGTAELSTRTLGALVDLAEVARAVAHRFGDRARAHDTTIRVDAIEPVHAVADWRQTIDAVGHLVENALRFGRGTRVDLRVQRTAASAELSVSRHGYGATFTMSLPLAS
jgi:hypothetical protein